MTTGFLYSQDFLYHNADPKIPHYESSDRLLACLNKLHQTSYFNSLFFPEMKKVPSEFFNEIHSNAHLQKIERSKGKRGYFDSDTFHGKIVDCRLFRRKFWNNTCGRFTFGNNQERLFAS